MSRNARRHGFTLIEVLVALVIVAFGMGALLATLASAANTANYLRDKSFAQWIAMNRITELRLRPERPGVGKTSGDVTFANQNWRWYQEIIDPGLAGLLRIDVSVVLASAVPKDNSAPPALAQSSGFIGTTVGPSLGNDPDWSPMTFQQHAGGGADPDKGKTVVPTPGQKTGANSASGAGSGR